MACASSFTNVFWKEPVFSLTHFAGWRVLELNERFLGLEKLLSAEVKKGTEELGTLWGSVVTARGCTASGRRDAERREARAGFFC